MESVSLRLYTDATGKHPNINVETQIPLELYNTISVVISLAPPSEMQLMHGNVKLADGATVTVMEGVAENFTCLSNGSIPASQVKGLV